MTRIVDTNVAIKANGFDPMDDPSQHALECLAASARFLDTLRVSGRIVLDDAGDIWAEYSRYMQWHGQLGPGHLFLLWVHNNQWNGQVCDRVEMGAFPGDPALSAFDPSDRKFVQTCMAHPDHPMISVSGDRVWRNFEAPLAVHGVRVEFLCPQLA